jgi:hypothetical protein
VSALPDEPEAPDSDDSAAAMPSDEPVVEVVNGGGDEAVLAGKAAFVRIVVAGL